jgi:hypothetical protein
MRVSQATSKPRPLQVPFEGGDLPVAYRPASYTVAELDELQANTRDTKRIVESMLRTLVSWELEYDEDAVDDEGNTLTGVIPLTTAALTKYVPTSVFVEIMRAMQEDQQAGEARATSDGS